MAKVEKASQGDFIKEVKGIRGSRTTQSDRFVWENNLVKKTKTDISAPEAKLQAIVTEKDKKTPSPTKDLPRKLSGQIDNVALKESLTAQLKSQKRK